MEYDAIIIGAGHNGLTCAGYLARAGLKVKVFEKRNVVGGAAVTEEFHPGFKNSVCSYVVSMLNPKIIQDLELKKHGMELIKRESGMFSILPNDQHLIISRDRSFTHAEISKFSKKDADAHNAFEDEIDELALIFRQIAEEAPPNLGGGIANLWKTIKVGNRLRKLSKAQQERLVAIMTMSLGDYLDNWFESDEVKGYYAGDGSIGNFASPYSAGSAYILLHHAFGSIDNQLGSWWHSKGGMGGITEAMARSAKAHGVEIEINSPVKKLLIDSNKNGQGQNRACGVLLENGKTVQSKIVAANCTPKLLFTKLIEKGMLPKQFEKRMEQWRCRSGSFRMNVALSELPKLKCLKNKGEDAIQYMRRSINICPSIAYMEGAYHDAKKKGWSSKPFISMNIASLIDDTLAPEGKHVAGLFCQQFNPELPDGRDWNDFREKAADLLIDTMNEYAPNFKSSVIARQLLSPKDLEVEFGLSGGDIFHGALHLDQLYSMRPAAGYADHATPIDHLYLCGSGTHPGGGVSGLPGKHAAEKIIKAF